MTHVLVTDASGDGDSYNVELACHRREQTKAPSYDKSELDGICQLLLSSGTSGAPKPIKMTFATILNSCIALAAKGAFTYSQNDISLLAQPLAHVGGQNCSFLCVAYSGANFLVTDYPGSVGLLEMAQKYKLTHVIAVPAVLNFLAKFEHLEKYDISSVKCIQTGASAPNFEAIDKILKRSGNPSIFVRHLYGASEMAGLIFTTNDFMTSKVESIGVALPGTNFKIVDVDDTSKVITEPGKQGELIVKQAFDYILYFNDPKKTKESLTADGFYKTGDMAYFDEDFNVYISSRIKDVIKFRGFSISPVELEDILMEHCFVLDCSVVGEPHDIHEAVPVAFVVPSEAGKKVPHDELAKTLIDLVAASVAEFKRIWKVYTIDKIPRNGNGKVLKRDLRDLLKK